MLKILYVSPNGYLGGAERFVLTATVAHKVEGNINAGILFFSDGEACKEAEKAGVDCFIIKNSFRFRNPFKLLLALKEIRKIVMEYDPDVLHLTMPYAHIVISLATFGLGIKKVWFQHGPVGGKLDKIAKFLSVDMIWYNCNYLKKVHHETWPRFKIKAQESIVSYGVDAKKSTHVLFEDSFIKIGTAGRICSWKGFHNIIKSLGELKQETSLRPYSFSIAGSAKRIQDLEYGKYIIELVDFYNLKEEIIFLDHVKDMEGFYQGVDVFIHSSVIPEPFGLVVAEAMLNGCLVVASDSGGVSDIMQMGANGLTFPATGTDSVYELKKILEKILSVRVEENINEYRELAKSGKLFIEENYSVTKMIKQIEDIYFNL